MARGRGPSAGPRGARLRPLWAYDHLTWRRYREHPWFAAIPWLSGLAASTERIRLGALVASPNFRHPLTLAKEAATLDHVSGGRLTLGLGAGGIGFDATVFGEPSLTPPQRAARLGEFVPLLDRLLRDPEASHRGAHCTVDDPVMRPPCLQRPRVPFAIAAGGFRLLALAARHGDTWVADGETSYRDTTLEGTEQIVRAQMARPAEECAAIGRDPATIDKAYLIGNTDERPLQSVEKFVDFAGRYAEIGITDLVFHHPRPDDPVWTEPERIVERLAVEGFPRLPAPG